MAPNVQDKIKGADLVGSTNHVTFLTDRFPRLISLQTRFFSLGEATSLGEGKL